MQGSPFHTGANRGRQRPFSTRNRWWSEDQTLCEGGGASRTTKERLVMVDGKNRGVARMSGTYGSPLLAMMII